jgi:hypothetical protein
MKPNFLHVILTQYKSKEVDLYVMSVCCQDISCLLSDRFQGAVVFAGCLRSQEGGAEQLKGYKNLHVVQMDITSDEEVTAALTYVLRNLPPQGESKVTTCLSLLYKGLSIHLMANTINFPHVMF